MILCAFDEVEELHQALTPDYKARDLPEPRWTATSSASDGAVEQSVTSRSRGRSCSEYTFNGSFRGNAPTCST